MGLLDRSKNKKNSCYRITHYPLRNAGFTLIELVVVFTVVAALTGLFLATYESEESQVRMATQEMASNIRRAQSNTLGAVEHEGTVPPGGWGVYMAKDSDQYKLYADMDGNHQFDGDTEHWRTEELPGDIRITSLGGASEADIAFEPPDPTTYINGTTTDEITITLVDDENNYGQVRVNFFGLIEVVK